MALSSSSMRCQRCMEVYDFYKQNDDCPHTSPRVILYPPPGFSSAATITPLPVTQRKVRLLHKNGLAFDFTVSKDFSLNAVVTAIRANGFLLVHEQCYIPQDDIAMMFFLSEGAMPDKPAQVINFPDNPKP